MHHMHRYVNNDNASSAFEGVMRVAHNAPMNLRTFRKAKKLSQQQLAEIVGVDQATIQRAETMHSSAKLDTYIKCAAALGISLSDLFSDDRTGEEALLIIAYRSSDPSRRRILDALTSEAASQPGSTGG